MRRGAHTLALVVLACACRSESRGLATESLSGESGSQDTSTSTSSSGSTSTTDSTTGPPVLDVAFETESGSDTERVPVCKVMGDMDAIAPCEQTAPPDSFEPLVQWMWDGSVEEEELWSITIPLVANLTDDNDDGEIDLCDVPDVIVNTYKDLHGKAHLYAFDGQTGQLHWQSTDTVHGYVSAALADIDDDGLPEIIAGSRWNAVEGGRIRAFEHTGAYKWTSKIVYTSPSFAISAIGIADLDNDGDAEIYAHNFVLDHTGDTLWSVDDVPEIGSATAAADLDGDGDLEVVFGHSAYHHDGTLYYLNEDVAKGFPQIADLDDDDDPEILLMNSDGIAMLEHNGKTKFSGLTPTNVPIDDGTWRRPATVHDFDGDGVSEFAVSSESFYSVYERDGTIVWSTPVLDETGGAAGTAFDFLGDGTADAMYADETTLHIFDGMGMPMLQVPRTSKTVTEYPIVADVDNDGSAEIVVTSNDGFGGDPSPTVQVIRDADDRWVQARRIWNQHTYHVTNVREDGTLPQFEQPSWAGLNTYRTNAQIEAGSLCKPEG